MYFEDTLDSDNNIIWNTDGGANYSLTFTDAGSSNIIFDMTSTGDFSIRESGNEVIGVSDAGAVTIGNSTSAQSVTIDAGTGAINIGTSNAAHAVTIGNSNTSATLALTGGDDWSIGTDGLTVLGASTNSFTFNPGSGPSYAGTARPTKKITLSPEYPGAVLTAFYGAGTDTNLTGAMTSDAETSATNTLNTYYQWERTTDATLHYYTVAVRVTLPEDFSAWATSNALQVEFVTDTTGTTANVLDVRVYLESDSTTAVAASTGNASGTADTWTTVTIDDSTLDDAAAPEWDAAGETAIIYLRMGSASSEHVRVGDVILNYLARF